LWGAAQLSAWQGDATTSSRIMEESLEMWRQLGDRREIALALEGLGWVRFRIGDDEQACAAFQESLSLQRESGDPHLINRAMVGLAQMLVALGRVDEARSASAEIFRFAGPAGDRRSEHYAWHYLADCELLENNCSEAHRLYRRSLELAREIGDQLEICFELQGVAMALGGLGEARHSLQLGGAAAAELRRLGADTRIRFWDALVDRFLGMARRTMGDPAATVAWSEGEAMGLDEAIVQALRPRSPH
jgi:tetratricopeptide (TPR) repeat protein